MEDRSTTELVHSQLDQFFDGLSDANNIRFVSGNTGYFDWARSQKFDHHSDSWFQCHFEFFPNHVAQRSAGRFVIDTWQVGAELPEFRRFCILNRLKTV